MCAVFCFDLDGTLCTNMEGDYEATRPFPWAIERVNALKQAGHRILIFTARGSTTGVDWREVTERQLAQWGVSYDELILGKPTADVYVDDKSLHVDAWRYEHARALPGGLAAATVGRPGLPPPTSTAVVEIGRTFGGRPYLLERHVAAVLAAAERAGLAVREAAAEIEQAVVESASSHRELLEPGDDVVFSIALTGMPHAAYADALDALRAPGLTVACRLLSQAAGGLVRFLSPGDGQGVAVRAATRGQAGAWPLGTDSGGRVHDLLGGELMIVDDRVLVARRPPEQLGVAARHVVELAERLGIDMQARPLDLDELAAAQELLIVSFPFCIVSVSSLDDRTAGAGRTGPLASALLSAWSADVALDVAGQLRQLAGESARSMSASTD